MRPSAIVWLRGLGMASRRTLVLVLLVVAMVIAAIYYVARTKPDIRPIDVAAEPTGPVGARDGISGALDPAPTSPQAREPSSPPGL